MDYFIVQDLALPWENISSFSDWIHDEFEIYPQWLCPLYTDGAGGGLNPYSLQAGSGTEKEANRRLMLNIGVWGPSPGEPVATNRAIEAKLMELKGLKWLYAQTFYTAQEFWSIYDQSSYTALRKKYNAEGLPDIYEKVGGTGKNRGKGLTGIWTIWPLAGVYGVLSCMKGGDYLRRG